MEINNLIKVIKEKLKKNIKIENISIEDKSFLHKKHQNFTNKKFHIRINIESFELKKINSIKANKKIYSILKEEMKHFVHSLQIKII